MFQLRMHKNAKPAKLHLSGLCAGCSGEKLVPKTDTEDRGLGSFNCCSKSVHDSL